MYDLHRFCQFGEERVGWGGVGAGDQVPYLIHTANGKKRIYIFFMLKS